MVVPTILSKIAAHWLFTCYRAARKLRSHTFLHKNTNQNQSQPLSKSHQATITSSLPCSDHASQCHHSNSQARSNQTLVCDFHGALLRCTSLFPYFMLVAFEGGSFLRALLLLCSSPLLWALGQDGGLGLRVMAFITFFGLRTKDMGLVARAVLPKYYLEALDPQVYDMWACTKRRVVVTCLPRVMVECFLKEYMGVDEVVGCELQVVKVRNGWYFTGLFCGPGPGLALRQKALREVFAGEAKADLGIVCHSNPYDHLFIPYCKEAYVVTKDNTENGTVPRDRYPKPLIFHDGRLAFLPSPSAMLALFLFLPLGVVLAIVRIMVGIVLPYKLAFSVSALVGLRFRVAGLRATPASTDATTKGVLYVCTHRTLVDPIMLTAALERPVPAVTYSLSRLSEMIAPIKTVRLTRDRVKDAATMRRLLQHGDLAVCPEGTTCREPYLLRFSPLFAELADNMEPVALDAQVTMLYGTTASGHKWLDPVAFMANPAPAYRVEFLGGVPRDWTRAGGRSAPEVANWVQRRLGDALGFECTGLTRRDKYMVLAGNDGVISK